MLTSVDFMSIEKLPFASRRVGPLLLLALHQMFGQSHDIRFEQIGVNDGLSNSTVTVIAQDQAGFIWLGTEDGLNRFDGLGFTSFYNDPRDSNSIPANVIYGLLCDREGTLWVGTARGLCRYDPAIAAFIRTPILRSGERLPQSIPAMAIVQDGRGALWVSSADSLYELIVHGFAPPAIRRSIGGGPTSLATDASGGVWFFRGSVLFRYRCETDSVERVSLPGMPRLEQILTIYPQSDSVLWLGSESDGAVRYDLKRSTFEHFLPGPGKAKRLGANVVSRILADGHGSVWISHFEGVDRYIENEKTITHYTGTPFNPYSLLGKRGGPLFIDRAGVLWIGTYHGGVNRIDPNRNRFTHLLPISENPRDERNGVRAVVEARDGGVWAGTDYGLRHFSRRGNRFVLDRTSEGIPAVLRKAEITALCEDVDGSLWVGSGAKLHHLFPQSGRIRTFQHEAGNPSSFSGSGILVIYRDRENEIWVGTEHLGVDRYDRRTSGFVHHRYSPADPGSLHAEGVWAIFEDSRRRVWFGAWNRGVLNVYDRTSGRFTQYPNDPNDPQSSSHDAVRAICEDDSGNLWFGTWAGGLSRLDMATNRFTSFTQVDGLPSDYIKAMLMDRRGKLWIASERGLTAFPIASRKPRNFTEKDGLQSDFFFSNSSCAGAGGLLYFGGAFGITVFHPDSIRDNPIVPPIVITEMKVFDKPVGILPSESRTEFRLAYDQNFVSFDFLAFDYSDPTRIQYAYRMEGLEKEWIPCGTRRYASYTHLDPGTYIFHVRGTNSDGVWNEAGTSVTFTIAPPFWQTLWFRGLAAALVASILYLGYRIRINRLLEVERLRTRIAADLHDDVGSNLSSIALASQLLSRKLILPSGEQAQLDEIGTTALQTSEMMKEIVWLLNPKNDSLDDLLLRMKSVAASLLRNIPYRFEGPGEKLSARVNLSMKRNLFLMYKEILNNVARHSEATDVVINVGYEHGRLRIAVHDNGRGFEADKPSPGNGLGNLADRSRQIGAKLRIVSAPGKGTAVTLESEIT